MLDDRDSGVDEPADNEGSVGVGDSLDGAAPLRIGPDGAPIIDPVVFDTPPPFEPTHCDCLRGPCRYLWTVRTHFDHGNAAGTLEHQPTYVKLMCTAQAGVHLEMSADSPVLECNRWDPMSQGEINEVAHRRASYYAEHPEHDPVVVAEQLEAELAAAEAEAEEDEPTYEEIIGGASDDGTDS